MTTTSPFMPDVRVEIAFDSGVRTLASARTWTDVSGYVELDREIQITRGRPDEISTTSPSTLSLTLDNRDGRFTPGLASGAYYPNVKIGRPIRVLAVQPGDVGNYLNLDQSAITATITDYAFTTALGTYALGSALTSVVTPVQGGSRSLRMTLSTSGLGNYGGTVATGLTVGRTYTYSVYVYSPTGSPNVRAEVAFLAASSYTALKDQWVRLSCSFVAVASTIFVGVATAASTAGQFVYLDSAQVWDGSAAVAFTSTLASAVVSTRFTGYVDEWPVEWDGSDASVYAPITATSRLARLGEGNELRSIIESEIMLDNPVRYYPLGEPSSATHSTDATGNDAVGMYSYTDAPGIEWGLATGVGTDGLPAVRIDPFQAGDDEILMAAYFEAPLTECTLEAFVKFSSKNTEEFGRVLTLYDTTIASDDYTYLSLGGTSAGGFTYAFGTFIQNDDGVASGVFANAPDTEDLFNGRTHHLALTYLPGATPQLDVYYDGVLVVSGVESGSVATTMPGFRLLTIGPLLVDTGDTPFSVSHAAVFDQVLSADRIAAHAEAGFTGFVGETADERLERYANYVGVDALEITSDVGVIPLGHVDSTGKTAESLMRLIEATEGGVLYDGRDGNLVFRNRDHRYTAVSAFTLDASTGDIGATGLRPSLDRAFIVNDVTAKSADDTTQQQFSDATAADDYGPKRQDLEMLTTDPDELLQAAGWRVNQYKDPKPRIPSLEPVDILPFSAALRTAIAEADISTRFTLAGLPSQAEGSTADVFIEGITETFGLESWRFVFNTSPADIYTDVWTVEDAVLGQYDAYPLSY